MCPSIQASVRFLQFACWRVFLCFSHKTLVQKIVNSNDKCSLETNCYSRCSAFFSEGTEALPSFLFLSVYVAFFVKIKEIYYSMYNCLFERVSHLVMKNIRDMYSWLVLYSKSDLSCTLSLLDSYLYIKPSRLYIWKVTPHTMGVWCFPLSLSLYT